MIHEEFYSIYCDEFSFVLDSSLSEETSIVDSSDSSSLVNSSEEIDYSYGIYQNTYYIAVFLALLFATILVYLFGRFIWSLIRP